MKRPNIILILIDDLGWTDLTCYGSSFYETPRLDALAAQGMRCLDAYASCPVCSPTRASIMSGKYPARLGLTNWIGGLRRGRVREAPYLHYLPLTEISVAAALRAGGYQTWHVGKWHLGDEPFYPEYHGFDVNIGGCHHGHPNGGYVSPWNLPGLGEAAPGTHLTDHLTDRALDLIRNRDAAQPFFLNLWHYAVHTPIQAPADLVAKYRDKARRLGLDKVNPYQDGGDMPALPTWEGGPMTRIIRRTVQSDVAYAAMIEHLDTAIGRLLDGLKAAGLEDDTLVLFTSDNGGLATAEGSPTCNAPLSEGKGWDREGGVRVCQIARWPGHIPAGALTPVPMHSCDLYPTMLAAAGLPPRPAQHRDGADLLPVLTGAGKPAERALFWHYPHYGNQGGQPAAWVLRDGWKLIHRYESGSDELFNLSEDIGERHDLSGSHPDIARALRSELTAWQQDVEARHPEPDPDYARLRALVPQVANNATD